MFYITGNYWWCNCASGLAIILMHWMDGDVLHGFFRMSASSPVTSLLLQNFTPKNCNIGLRGAHAEAGNRCRSYRYTCDILSCRNKGDGTKRIKGGRVFSLASGVDNGRVLPIGKGDKLEIGCPTLFPAASQPRPSTSTLPSFALLNLNARNTKDMTLFEYLCY